MVSYARVQKTQPKYNNKKSNVIVPINCIATINTPQLNTKPKPN